MIDWFTVSAQIINFLILVFLLKKFLYGPIIRAMDKREQTITGRLNEAEQKRTVAQSKIETYRKKNEDFESQRADMLAKAKERAEEREKELVEAARKEVDGIKARWQEAVGQEKEAFIRNLRHKMAGEVHTIAKRVFADLADMSLEEHMTDMFIKKMHALDREEQEKIKSKLRDSAAGITVATSFGVPEHKLQAVTEAVRNITGPDAQPEFVLSKDIICGIELRAKDYKLGWNVDKYLKSLEEEFGRVLGG